MKNTLNTQNEVDENNHLTDLLPLKLVTYWDYTESETLLTMQRPRTNYSDEQIYLTYHQITELYCKLMIKELKELVYDPNWDEVILLDKIERLNRYSSILISSVDILTSGIDKEQYFKFKLQSKTSSNIQSVQSKIIEVYSTSVLNLINDKTAISNKENIEECFEFLHWKKQGMCAENGKKSEELIEFEIGYEIRLINLAKKLSGKTLNDRIRGLELKKETIKCLRKFDYLYNVGWPLAQIETANSFENSISPKSEWHSIPYPADNKRMFFPSLWNENEINDWGSATL